MATIKRVKSIHIRATDGRPTQSRRNTKYGSQKKDQEIVTKTQIFSVNLIETGAGLAFLDAADAGTAAQSLLKGDIQGGIKTLTSAFKNNKDQMVRIGAGALAAKLVVGSLGGSKVLGKIGPLALRA